MRRCGCRQALRLIGIALLVAARTAAAEAK